MELNKQVVSLELAKRLKELGVKQRAQFYWDIHKGKEALFRQVEGTLGQEGMGRGEQFSAFTVAELGEMLPTHLDKDGRQFYLRVTGSHGLNDWYTAYYDGDGMDLVVTSENTEADARAKMFIYLIENKLITV